MEVEGEDLMDVDQPHKTANLKQEDSNTNAQDEEDYVTSEVDIFLTKELSDQLFLFQHPLRPSHKPYPQEKLSDLKMKPKQHKFEMEFAFETDGDHYDKDNQVGESQTKSTLTSSEVAMKTNYAVGIYRNSKCKPMIPDECNFTVL